MERGSKIEECGRQVFQKTVEEQTGALLWDGETWRGCVSWNVQLIDTI